MAASEVVPARHTDCHDEATLHTLEAVIVLSLMISAIVFVVTYESPVEGSAPVRSLLQTQAEDALDILYDTQLADGRGDAMSAFILDCMQGDCANLTQKMDKLLPTGAGYAVYVSNGGGLYPVYVEREPPGEALTARHLLEPSWSHTFLTTGIPSINPTEDALTTFALPVHKSMPLAEGGSPILVRVHGTRVSDGADYVLTGAFSTRAYDATDASRAPAASLYFRDSSGAPLAHADLTSHTLMGGSLPSLTNVTFRLRLEETQGVEIPEGTELNIRIPAGWLASANQSWNNPYWTVTQNATDYNASFTGSDITARLVSSFSSGTRDFQFNATYRGDVVDYYPFHATLSRGAASHATLLVKADSHGTQPALEVPLLEMSVPKPMGANADTKWTLAAVVPDDGGLLGSQAVDITRVEILEGDGALIFGDVDDISGGGNWEVEDHKLVWTGTHRAQHGAPLNLTFRVTASGVAGGDDTRSTYLAPATFEGWSGRILPQVAPGLYRGTFLPESGGYQGYNDEIGLGLSATHVVVGDGVYRTTSLPGNANYTVGYFLGLKDALHGSYIDLEDRTVPLGTNVTLDLDVQSALYTLAGVGFTPEVTLRVYPPWAPNATGAIIEETLLDPTLVIGGLTLLDYLDTDNDGTADPSTMGRLSFTHEIPENWLFGTYPIEVELSWNEEVTEVLGGVPVTETFARTARIYDYFVVAPHDGLLPASPVYDVHLVTWFDDWR